METSRIAPKLALIVVLAAAVTTACDSSVSDPGIPPFQQYVAMGGSFTAGAQASGLSVNSQLFSWPALVAANARTDFVQPIFAAPGCPPPISAPFGQAVDACSARTDPGNDAVDNVAVPNERIGEAVFGITVFTEPHLSILGPKSQLEAMAARHPTFVSIELGFHDVLSAALTGSNTDLTSQRQFDNAVAALVTELNAQSKMRGAVILSVIDPTLYAPQFQPGAYYYLARDAAGRFHGKPVNINCSPVTVLGTPNPLAWALIPTTPALSSTVTEINCDPARGTQPLLVSAELVTLRQAIDGYNDLLHQAADANGWAFVDLNALYASLRASQSSGRYNELRMCQLLPTATTAAQFQAAVLNTCPVTGATGAPNFFGASVSLDGITPSNAAHQAIARAVLDVVNAKYGTSL